jgi:hypothetical protein
MTWPAVHTVGWNVSRLKFNTPAHDFPKQNGMTIVEFS